MAIDEVVNAPWIRKHDRPGTARTAARILYPRSLQDLIKICSTRLPGTHLRAAGSHWALSPAAVSDGVFIETHDPGGDFAAMGCTLRNVVPRCLSVSFLQAMAGRHPARFVDDERLDDQTNYLVHIETGKRIYQLYAELDQGEESDPDSLASVLERDYGNREYRGPWAFRTLGGAGGQTVFGALTTGTHGGDHLLPPIADDVAALHLVTDGGRHYWIEPDVQPEGVPLTDDAALIATFGGVGRFDIIRNDEVFNAVLVSAGRFGIVYSVVLRAVRQYMLHEERRLAVWQDVDGTPGVRSMVGNPASALYSRRFLQAVVCMTPHHNQQRHLVGVTKRWNVAPGPGPGSADPSGRAERVGKILHAFDPFIGGPRFEFAGTSHSYSPDPKNPDAAAPPSFLERACAHADFIEGVIATVIEDIGEFLDSGEVVAGTAIAELIAPGAAGLLLLSRGLLAILKLLKDFLDAWDNEEDHRLGETMNDLKGALLGRADPEERAAGVFAWQFIGNKIFSSEQKALDYDAISYAVMDRHDYRDLSCNVNVDSIEVFFDATDPMLLAFVDALLAYEIWQEREGRTFIGYISLRFTARTRASLGMSRYPLTCAVEVAGLKDVSGVTELIDFAIGLSMNRNFPSVLHWGQRNETDVVTTEDRFGWSQPSGGDLGAWRRSLHLLTDAGALDGFSSAFTRRTGLEIT